MGAVYSHLSEEEPGHPDRDRQWHRHTGDRHDARAQRVHHQQGNQAQHVVPIQRERVVPAIPAQTPQNGPVDRALLHRRARAAQGRTAQDEATQTASPVVRAPVDAGGRMAGMRLLSAAYQRQVACPVAG